MAIVIESVTSSSGYELDDGTTGSAWYWDITKPTGLTAGDLLFAITQNEYGEGLGAPAGWTGVSGPGSVGVAYKVADSGDVAASTFRFSTADTSNRDRAAFRLYRISGAGSVVPQDSFYGSFTSSDSSGNPFTANLDPNIDPPNGTLMFYIVAARFFGFPNITSVAITGPTGTVTTTKDNDSVEDAILFIAEQTTTSAADITNIAVNYTAGQTVFTVNVSALALYPQQDASTSLTTTVTGNTAFAPAGSAGAHTSLTITETSNTKFDPTGVGTRGTNWQNETKPTTDWANEQKNV